uniref:MTS domain-containing protein n=1 Tax=Angiostrongylus cantonensis TaxID=6313 RepID=A0A0K0DMH4_ANGCA
LSLLQENVEKNCLSNICEVKGLDWQDADNIKAVVDELTELDYLIASDVFYDVCTFRPLMTTVHTFFQRFPLLQFYFSYAEREYVLIDIFLKYKVVQLYKNVLLYFVCTSPAVYRLIMTRKCSFVSGCNVQPLVHPHSRLS